MERELMGPPKWAAGGVLIGGPNSVYFNVPSAGPSCFRCRITISVLFFLILLIATSALAAEIFPSWPVFWPEEVHHMAVPAKLDKIQFEKHGRIVGRWCGIWELAAVAA